ncbi:FAD-dependent oxidoreductase [Actinomycetospora corticicola]|uniref:2,4-dienoyl-CoA reductase-like NADH-dependent reductase (Old Yellow Enzyme family) n=1 Tax=Actinomycetospora corticicola TaxID=663602 RepID=A0A7Y9E1E1_9PSEU|nr:NAD(P)-binding protein [Actinomycetospora corticicola]NYD39267.1 2,4-dienoyl-CoA reductase-like NADH-dependent reductase (Old Yellow Enzyme family) [Actinomycetospora corticicola]
MLTDPAAFGAWTLPSRVLFGPHATNTSADRGLGSVEHYRARALGGAGVIVTEVASVTPDDHPYEYAPLAASCAAGWAATAAACAPALVLAGLGHAGSQSAARGLLRAPSSVPDPATRVVPRPLSAPEVDGLVEAFTTAGRAAVDAGCGGVEIAAGQYSLLREFRSGLSTPTPDDRVLVTVLEAVRAAIPSAWVGLRLCVDELAPWAGITLDGSLETVDRVADLVDHVVPVRGSAMSAAATRPDAHVEPGFMAEACRVVRAVVAGRCAVVLAGSVVDPAQAQEALDAGVADLVEMTRAQLADPTLVATVRAGRVPRPCVLTNQACRVRDVRNPRIGCTVEPSVGAPSPDGSEASLLSPGDSNDASLPGGGGELVVAGAGPAGLEAARTLALAGRAVRLVERDREPGGLLRVIATLPGRQRFARLADWYVDELVRLGVSMQVGAAVDGPPDVVATGGRDADRPGLSVLDVLRGAPLDGPVVIDDPLGDGSAVALAEHLAATHRVALVTADQIVGKQLHDVVGAASRLQLAGVERVLEHRVVERHADHVVVADVVTGARRTIAGTLVDAGPREPSHHPSSGTPIGDARAPRTVTAAIREGRRAAEEILRAG